MTKSLEFQNIDWDILLSKLSHFATSQTARTILQKISPFSRQEEATQRFSEVLQARDVVQKSPRPFMESIDLYPVWHERVKKRAVLKTIEFQDVRTFCLECLALRETLMHTAGSWSKVTLAQLMKSELPLQAIDLVLAPGGEIRIDASPKLFHLHNKKTDTERLIRTTLDKYVKSYEMESLVQDRYVTNREGRWVLPIRSGMQGRLDGIIHDSSQTKQTVFMEPQTVVKLNNEIREIGIEIEKEIERILTELSAYLASLTTEFESTYQTMLQSDVLFAIAQFTDRFEGTACEFMDSEIFLPSLRHPLLVIDAYTAKKEIVPNDIHIREERGILLLSGPNAGGKTVLLKAVGLTAQMARCGIPICCESGAKLPFFEKILVAIGDSQSVSNNLSTFAAHLNCLVDATQSSGPRHLILVDEICGATDPEEGGALARSFLEHYGRQNIYGVVTSHLSGLKHEWTKDDRTLNASMQYDDRVGRSTYRLLLGTYGRSFAIQTAKKVGVPKSIIDRALSLMSPRTIEREELLSEIESYKQDVIRLQGELRTEINGAKEKKKQYSDLVEKFKRDREIWLKKSVQIGERKIDQMVERFRADRTENRSAKDVKFELQHVVKCSPRQSLQTPEEFSQTFPPGAIVYVPTLGQNAVVQGRPTGKGEVSILSNSMRLQIHWRQLQPPQHQENPTRELIRRSRTPHFTTPSGDRTIDLRGKRVDEALETLEIQLDLAVRQEEYRVKIIHGHGTEALKKAVRAYLSRSNYVNKWQAGEVDGGGDGLTLAELAI